VVVLPVRVFLRSASEGDGFTSKVVELVDLVPVDDMPPGVDIGMTSSVILEVVGVFP